MKANFLKNYKRLMVIWIAIGILVSGYFFIFPVMHRVEFDPNNRMAQFEEEKFGPQYAAGKHFEVAVLITLVGAVLIGGLGYTSNSKD